MYTFSASEYAALQELADETGLDIRFRSDYSGRGMFGDHCLALDLPRGVSETQAMMAIVKLLHEQVVAETVENAKADDEDVIEDKYNLLENLFRMSKETRSDNMGLGSIVYWPNTKVEDNGDSDDEDGE